MPRQPRQHLDRIPLHIVQRGHNGAACFGSDADRRTYLGCLGDALLGEGCTLHAYVLMTNHVHLLLTPETASAVPRLMIALGRNYVRHVNDTYGRTGTLWEGRYKSSLVSTDQYLLACHRYIEMNPVRAGLVGQPILYRWSSHRANASGEPDALVTPHVCYTSLGRTGETRARAYRQLFDMPLEPQALDDIRTALRRGSPVGRAAPQRGRPRKRPLVDAPA